MKDVEGWIDQLVRFYKEIVENPDIPAGNLDEANDAICRCIEELRPLTKTYADEADEDPIDG